MSTVADENQATTTDDDELNLDYPNRVVKRSLDTNGHSLSRRMARRTTSGKFEPGDESGGTKKLERVDSITLEANAQALTRRMASMKLQNAERRQTIQSITSSQTNSLVNQGVPVTELNIDETARNSIKPVVEVAETVESVVKEEKEEVSEIVKLQAELQAYKERERGFAEREKAYLEQIEQAEEENEKFQLIAVEFEQIFHLLIKDKDASEDKLRREILELTKERDQLEEDVLGIERSFDDLHRRFENLKLKVIEFKKNEESLHKVVESYREQLEKERLKYVTLKKHAEEKLDK